MCIRSRFKRVFAYFAVALCAVFALDAQASWTYTGTFNGTSGTLTEDGVPEDTRWVLNVSKSAKKYPLTITGVAQQGASTTLDFTTINDSYTVTTFGQQAFQNNSKVEYVIAPEATKFDGNNPSSYGAFRNCTNLVDVIWKSGVNITVGAKAFSFCSRLTFPSRYDAGTGWTVMSNVVTTYQSSFNGCGLSGKVYWPHLACLGSGQDYSIAAPNITEQKVNFNVSKNVSSCMFTASNTKLETLSGLNGCLYAVTALNNLSNLKSITFGSDTLPGKVRLVGGDKYSWLGSGSAANLEYVYLGNNVTNIGSRVFNGCTKLNYIRWPGTKPSIDSYAFGSAGTAKDTVLRQYFPGTNATWRAEITKNAKYTAWNSLDEETKGIYTGKYGTTELPDGYCSEYVDLTLRKGFVFFYGGEPPPTVTVITIW